MQSGRGLIKRLERGAPARLWSAGCSTGEEPWSLAMTLLGPDHAAGAALARRDIRILASDIATHALIAAQAARYRAAGLTALPPGLRNAWTTIDGDQAAIAPDMRAIVRFRPLNLLDLWPMAGRFDAIFCRNVMIYFDNPTKERLISRFADILVPGGMLYVGHSERITGPALSRFTPMGPTIYRMTGPA